MKIRIKDIRTTSKGVRYSYCMCGREVTEGKDDTCPFCRRKITWPEEVAGVPDDIRK